MRSQRRVVRGNFFALIILSLAACTQNQGAFTTATAVSPTSLPATTTIQPAVAAVPPTATKPTTSASQITPAMPTPIADTPTPLPVSLACPESATADKPLLPVPTNLVRVLYLNDDLWLWREETSISEPLTSGGGVTYYLLAPDNNTIVYEQDGKLWLWRRNQEAILLIESNDIENVLFSKDGAIVAFSKALGDDQYELWAANSDDGSLRQLATASGSEIWARDPKTYQVDFRFRWAKDTHILIYDFYASLAEMTFAAPEPIFLVDADTSMTLPTLPANADINVHHGYRLLFVRQDGGSYTEFQLINAESGRTELVLPTRQDAAWSFSSGGRYLIASVEDGAVIVDLADLSQKLIPVPYRSLGMSHGSFNPPGWWVDESTWIIAAFDGPTGHEPGGTFTLWRVNAADGTAVSLNTFRGSIEYMTISPDYRYVTFRDNSESDASLLTLHLVDTTTGQDTVYDNGRSNLFFDHWLSNSDHFIYSYEIRDNESYQRCFLLGHISRPSFPQPVTTVLGNNRIQWLDDTRFIQTENIVNSESESQGTMILHSLNGEKVVIGDFLKPNGTRPYDNFTAYFEES